MLARTLAERGVLDLDAPLSITFPALRLTAPFSPDSITLRDLLAHHHGIVNGGVSFRTAWTGDAEDEELLRVLADHSEVGPRGFSYGNTSYVLAALAIGHATGIN